MAAGKDREMFHEKKNLLQPSNPSVKNLSPQSKAKEKQRKKERKKKERRKKKR